MHICLFVFLTDTKGRQKISCRSSEALKVIVKAKVLLLLQVFHRMLEGINPVGQILLDTVTFILDQKLSSNSSQELGLILLCSFALRNVIPILEP